MSFFISEALAEPGIDALGAPGISQFIFLGGFVLIFYFLLWRPQNKRQKEQKALISSIDKGDEVVIGGGLMGKIIKVDGDYAVLEIANNTQVKIQKSAVAATLPKGTLKAI
ncbi:MAG: preprotein translocase subunit YajC [Pseudomonadales bacterium]|nr:preprotein translocase subunit YajC [Pseudomonadales bacterium]